MTVETPRRATGTTTTRTATARLWGAVMLATALGCSDPGSNNATGPEDLEAFRAQLASAHKVQVPADKAADLERQGAKVLGDYGSFKLLHVEDAALAKVKDAAAEVRDDYNHILLNAGTLDTTEPSMRRLMGIQAPASGKRFHLVQFVGPIQPKWYEELESSGVQIVTYIPNNTYLVYGDARQLNSLQSFVTTSSAVQWYGAYLDDYKLHPSINKLATKGFTLQLVKDDEANAKTLELIRSLQKREVSVQEALGYVNVTTEMDKSAMFQVAMRPDVVSIHPYVEPTLLDERQNMIISGNLTGNLPSGPGWLAWLTSKGFTQAQFTASGFGVDVSDSGVDNATPATPNHFSLYVDGNVNGTSRLVYARLEGTPNTGSTLQGCDGHGNINAHIIGGYTNRTGAPFTDAAGYAYGLGVAPFVKLGSSVVFDPGTFTSPNYENLQSRAYRDGMRISSNSWGAATNTYTTDAQRYDALVRDAQPTISAVPNPGNQEMIILFAAGNNGAGANSVGSPGTAKNIITVGASENVHPFGGADGCGINDTGADSAMDIISFSSRGPASDGRKKPDIMAPGTHVTGGVAQAAGQRAEPPAVATGQANSCFDASGVCAGVSNDFFPAGQQWYTASSGTSHSTPALAGAAALVYQYFLNQGRAAPSPAMTKAYLMNSTRYMTGVGANDNLFSNNQGMGLLDMGIAFDGIPRLLDDQTATNLFTATGETRTFEGTIADTSKPFRVTLAWTDAPGSTTGSAWRNNLDLTVTLNGNTYRGNVFTGALSTTGGTADASNNVESVFLPAGTSGNFTITVTATNINSDGVPNNASALDQDFALIVYNSCDTAAPAVSGVTATASADNQIDIDWTPNGARAYRIYRSLTAGGPYTRVAEVGAPPYADIGVSGTTTYYYVVRAVECAESPDSNEASATATGVCTLPPTFAGITSATSAGQATCTNTVNWAAATPVCGGTVSYSVYRGNTPGFVPSLSNRIATNLSGTSFSDDLNLTSGATYYYVVRATEVSNATNEDTNTVERAARVGGAVTPGVRYFDDFDGNRPPSASAYWIPQVITGAAGAINVVNNCRWQSATNAYRIGAANTACGGNYANSQTLQLTLGGDGTTAGINGFAFPATPDSPVMTFNVWYNLESGWDGVRLVYSTTGATGPWTAINDSVSATEPYIAVGGYDGVVSSQRSWTNLNTGSNGALKAVSVNVAALAGRTAWFGFRFVSDGSVVREGFYVDDVRINADTIASCTTSTPPPGPAVGYRIANLPASVQAGVATSVDIIALDALGQTSTGYTGTAVLSASDAQAELPATVTFTAGVATGVSITLGTVGTQSIRVSDDTDPSINGSGTTTVTPGAPDRLSFTAQPANVVAGVSIAPSVRVALADRYGNPATTGTTAITVALGNNPGGGTLGGTTTVNAVAGVATFSNLSVNKTGTGYTLEASATGLTGATSNGFDVSPAAPARLRFTTQPSNAGAGASITPAVQVSILDNFDNVTTATSPVTLTLSTNPGSSTLGGSATMAAVNGVATFSDIWLNKVGTGYRLTASSGTLTADTSGTFNITPGAPFRVGFTGQPSDVVAGSSIAPAVQVTVYDRYDNHATQATLPVTLSLGSNPGGSTLSGTLTANAVGGVASFNNLMLNRVGNNYALIAGASGLRIDTSVGFDVSAGAPARLAFITQPANAASGASIAPAVRVAVQDVGGNLVTGTPVNVTLSLASNPAGGSLSGTTSATTVNGVASFANLTLDKVGSYSLAAASTGLTGDTSASFAISPGAPARLAFQAPPSDGVAGAPLAPLQVAVLDAAGNTVTSASNTVTVALDTNPSSGRLSGLLNVRALNGVATFSNLAIDKAGTGYTLRVTSGTLTGATSSGFDITANVAAKLVFRAQPSNAVAGTPAAPVQVEIQDAWGNLTSDTLPISLSLSGASTSLGGTPIVPAVAGVASFADLVVTQAATGYRLTASGPGVTSITSNAFDVSASAAAKLAFITQPANATSGASIAPAVRVAVQDMYGNLVTGTPVDVTLSLASNPAGGTLSGTTSATTVNGVASFSNLALDKAGSYSLAAASTGLSGETSASFAISAGAPTALAFIVPPVNGTAGTTLQEIQVAVQDAAGNTVTSASNVISLALGNNPSSARLNGTTSVLAVNGVATFFTLSLDKAASGYTLSASARNLSGASSSAFDIAPGSAARLVFKASPANTSAGSTLGSVQVEIQDAFGNTTPDTSAISLSLGGASGGTLGGTSSKPAVSGLASFDDLFINQAARGYTLTAAASGLPNVTSAAFDVAAGSAASLAFDVQPSNSRAGRAISPAVKVSFRDALGNVTSDTGNVTLTLNSNASGGTLSGTSTVAASNGVASFADLSINRVGSGYSLSASSGSLSATSAAFNVQAGPPARLSFNSSPASTSAGSVFAPLLVEVRDDQGNLISDSTAAISLSLGGASGGSLGGTSSANAAAGVASFGDLFINKAANGYTLTASASGLMSASTGAFNVAPGAAAQLVFQAQPGTTQAGMPLAAVSVAIQDALGNVVTSATDSVSLDLGTNPANGSLNGSKSVAASNGIATFSDLAIARAANGYTLSASAGSLTAASSSAFNITVGPPARLALKSEPANTTAGADLGTFEVELHDAYDNLITQYVGDVSLMMVGDSGGSMYGPLTAAVSNGKASFSGMSIAKAGTYHLVATAPGYASATSANFTVAPGNASRYSVSFAPSVSAGQEASLSLMAFDAHGNLATGYSGTAKVSSSDANAVLPADSAFSNGELKNLKVTFKSAGFQSLTIADAANNLSASVQTNVAPFSAPLVSILSPENQGTVAGKATISAAASVAQGTSLARLSILLDGQVIATGSELTLSTDWDTTQVPNNSTHTLTAVAVDAAGNVSSSAPVGVTVKQAGGCGCTGTGADASLLLALLALGRYASLRTARRSRR